MSAPRILVSGPASGSGKTTAAALLILLLRRRGLIVQPFKVGPDYIHGSYHEAVSGRVCRTLDLWREGGREGWTEGGMDGWMGGESDVRRESACGMQGADLGVVEGVMGLLDSGSPDGVDASRARVAESAAAVVAAFRIWPGSGRTRSEPSA